MGRRKPRTHQKPQPRVVALPGGGESPRAVARHYGVLVAAVVLVFSRSLLTKFTDWDDGVNITQNPGIIAPSWERTLGFWTHPYSNLYVPLVYTSFLWDRAVSLLLTGGLAPLVFKLHNLILHAGSACLVYRIVARLVPAPAAALAGALLFAVHPLQVEPVVWATGRKDVLSGFLVLASLERFQAFSASRKRRDYALASLAFVLSLLAKPAAITAPILAWMLVVAGGEAWRRATRELMPWFALSVVWVFVTRWSQVPVDEHAHFWVPLWQRPFVAVDSLLFYFEKLLLPVGLTPVHPRGNPQILASGLIWVKPLILIVAVGFPIWRIRRLRLPAAMFTVPLLPVLGLTPFIFQYHSNVADRYCYVPMLGAALAAGTGLAWLWGRFPPRRFTIAATAGGLLAVLGVLSIRQAGFWQSSETLWARVLALSPCNTAALFNLASNRAESGDRVGAMALFDRILEVDPAYGRPIPNLIKLSKEAGDAQRSQAYARRGLTMPMTSIDNYLAVGASLMELERPREAAEAFRAAVAGMPDSAECHNFLGLALLALHDDLGAVDAFRNATLLAPDFASPRANLGLVLLHQQRLQEAAQELEVAVKLDPNDRLSEDRLAHVKDLLAGKPVPGATKPK